MVEAVKELNKVSGNYSGTSGTSGTPSIDINMTPAGSIFNCTDPSKANSADTDKSGSSGWSGILTGAKDAGSDCKSSGSSAQTASSTAQALAANATNTVHKFTSFLQGAMKKAASNEKQLEKLENKNEKTQAELDSLTVERDALVEEQEKAPAPVQAEPEVNPFAGPTGTNDKQEGKSSLLSTPPTVATNGTNKTETDNSSKIDALNSQIATETGSMKTTTSAIKTVSNNTKTISRNVFTQGTATTTKAAAAKTAATNGMSTADSAKSYAQTGATAGALSSSTGTLLLSTPSPDPGTKTWGGYLAVGGAGTSLLSTGTMAIADTSKGNSQNAMTDATAGLNSASGGLKAYKDANKA